jgi:hypothetical protein
MARTQVNAAQILNGTIQKEDLNTNTPGKAVITNLIAGNGISLSSSGVDQGTGSVTINVVRNIDGGSPDSVYARTQSIDGGGP